MATSRTMQQVYIITPSSLIGVVDQINMVLQTIASRLDAMGTAPFASAGQTNVTDAVTAHGAATTSELDALGVKINQILNILESSTLMEA